MCSYFVRLPWQFQLALMNLCINARDAMPSGGKLVLKLDRVDFDDTYCLAHPDNEPGPHLAITVSDTGCGMSSEVCERIFEPFFTTKENGKGTGLGMAMVYGMVQRHSGTICVESRLGEGARFIIHLPIGELPDTTSDDQGQSPAKVSFGGAETILVAEDDQPVRSYLDRILRKAGYTTLLATDGEEAQSMFMEHAESVDLVLTDVVMPNASGLDVGAFAKAVKPEVGLLYCTGYPNDHDQVAIARQTGVRIIRKPIDYTSLLCAVREVLEERSHSAPCVG